MQVIRDKAALSAFAQKAKSLPWIAFDTETIGISPRSGKKLRKDALILDRARAFLLTFYHPLTGPVAVVLDRAPFLSGGKLLGKAPKALKSRDAFKLLEPVFHGPKIVMHNANYDLNVAANDGIDEAHVNAECTITLSHCADENRPATLKEASRLVGMSLVETKTVDFADADDVLEYACNDAVATGRLYQAMTQGRYYDHAAKKIVPCPDLIVEKERLSYYERVEKPVMRLVIPAERRGFRIDLKFFADMERKMRAHVSALHQKIFELAGRAFNVGSPPQLQQVLFEDLGLPPSKQTKTGWATDEEALFALRGKHPIIDLLMDERETNKLLRTYVSAEQGLPAYADAYGFIHASVKTTGAITGRMSVTLPPLQTIPKSGKWPVREGFIARDGHALLVADYAGMEARLMAIFCNDPEMVRCFVEGLDYHQQTADACGVDRQRGKTINFALQYLCSPQRLALLLTMGGTPTSLEQAKEYRYLFFNRYKRIVPFVDAIVDFHRKHGYITYLNGRKRRVEGLDSPYPHEFFAARRVLCNCIIQGSGAGWLKEALIRLDKNKNFLDLGGRFLLSVHDEIVAEAPEGGRAEEALAVLKEEMERPPAVLTCPLRVPLLVEAKAAKNWKEAK